MSKPISGCFGDLGSIGITTSAVVLCMKALNPPSDQDDSSPSMSYCRPPVRDPKLDERLVINIRGKRFETYTETLNSFPDTLLGSPNSRLPLIDRSTNELILTGDLEVFEAVLFFYQSQGVLGQ